MRAIIHWNNSITQGCGAIPMAGGFQDETGSSEPGSLFPQKAGPGDSSIPFQPGLWSVIINTYFPQWSISCILNNIFGKCLQRGFMGRPSDLFIFYR